VSPGWGLPAGFRLDSRALSLLRGRAAYGVHLNDICGRPPPLFFFFFFFFEGLRLLGSDGGLRTRGQVAAEQARTILSPAGARAAGMGSNEGHWSKEAEEGKPRSPGHTESGHAIPVGAVCLPLWKDAGWVSRRRCCCCLRSQTTGTDFVPEKSRGGELVDFELSGGSEFLERNPRATADFTFKRQTL